MRRRPRRAEARDEGRKHLVHSLVVDLSLTPVICHLPCRAEELGGSRRRLEGGSSRGSSGEKGAEEEEGAEEWGIEASGEEGGQRKRRSGSSGRTLLTKDSDPESTRDEIDSDGILHFRCGVWGCGGVTRSP